MDHECFRSTFPPRLNMPVLYSPGFSRKGSGGGLVRGISGDAAWALLEITTVRLNVEENQLVNVFGEFGICLGGLKSA
jgi:hypothetical protein